MDRSEESQMVGIPANLIEKTNTAQNKSELKLTQKDRPDMMLQVYHILK